MVNRTLPLILLLCVSPAALAEDAPARPKKGLAAIPGRMQALVAKHQISGAVTLVASRTGILHHEAVGLADLKSKTPMRKDTLFAIASMTKPITATAVMILRDEGKLSLDDPVAKYVPSFKAAALKTGPAKRPITIRDLLTHTSGLVGSQKNTGTLKQTAETLARRPLGFQPGTKWQYSPGLSVCGRIIEVASGQPYEEFLQKRIFDPLKMTDTTFKPNAAQKKRIATMYRPGKDKKSLARGSHWLLDDPGAGAPNPSGGLFSTAADLAKFYRMVLNGGELDGKRVLSKAGVKLMTRVHTGNLKTGFTPGNGWGLGWCIVRKPQGVTRMLNPGTFGHGGAFGTQGWVDPKAGRIYVLLIQRTGFGNGDASNVREAFQSAAAPAKKPTGAGTQIRLKIETDEQKTPDEKTVQRAVRVIKARLKKANISGATVRVTGRRAITVTLSTADDKKIKRIADLVSRPGTLQFALLANRRDHAAIIRKAGNIERDVRKGDQVIASWRNVAMDAVGKPLEISTIGEVVTRLSPNDPEVTQFLVAYEPADRRIEQSELSRIYATADSRKRLAIGFQLTKSAAKKMARLTGDNLPAKDGFRRRLAVLIDGQVVTAPSIVDKIEGEGIVHGKFTRQSIQNLVTSMSVGECLPVVVSSVTIEKR